jgi:hypothetical protein
MESNLECNRFLIGQSRRAKEILELIHSDICGPMQTLSIGGAKYFLTFIDDFPKRQ